MTDFLETFNYTDQSDMILHDWTVVSSTSPYDVTFPSDQIEFSADVANPLIQSTFRKPIGGTWNGIGVWGPFSFDIVNPTSPNGTLITQVDVSNLALNKYFLMELVYGVDSGITYLTAYTYNGSLHTIASGIALSTGPWWFRTLKSGSTMTLQVSYNGTSYSNIGVTATYPADTDHAWVAMSANLSGVDSGDCLLDDIALQLVSSGPTYYTPNVTGAYKTSSQTFVKHS